MLSTVIKAPVFEAEHGQSLDDAHRAIDLTDSHKPLLPQLLQKKGAQK
jgi:hypothetical protein